MTDYPLAVGDFPAWGQYAVTTSLLDAATVEASYDAALDARFYAVLETADYTALEIAGVRLEIEVLSGAGTISWISEWHEEGTSDDGLGNRNFYSGETDVSVAGGDSLTWLIDASTFAPFAVAAPSPAKLMERLAVGAFDPSNVSFEVRQETGGPLVLTVRLVAFTIDSIGGPPLIQWPRWDGKRTVKRLWPPPGNQQ